MGNVSSTGSMIENSTESLPSRGMMSKKILVKPVIESDRRLIMRPVKVSSHATLLLRGAMLVPTVCGSEPSRGVRYWAPRCWNYVGGANKGFGTHGRQVGSKRVYKTLNVEANNTLHA